MTSRLSRPPRTSVLFLPVFLTKSSGCSFSSFSAKSDGMLLCCVAVSPQPIGRIVQQRTITIEVADRRIARGLVVRDEIIASFPLGCSDGPKQYSSNEPDPAS